MKEREKKDFLEKVREITNGESKGSNGESKGSKDNKQAEGETELS